MQIRITTYKEGVVLNPIKMFPKKINKHGSWAKSGEDFTWQDVPLYCGTGTWLWHEKWYR